MSNSLTLKDLSNNAYRILGLTSAATQVQIDAAARKMRIWQDSTQIPPSVNDAAWIGPVPRNGRDIENAVARLTDPTTRISERFWWFCKTPPESDIRSNPDTRDIAKYHDAALIILYRSLLTNVDENLDVWKDVMARFKSLAASDDYLQWLFAAETAGDFDKRASLEEIANAQERLPGRLSTAVSTSIDDALADGDFEAAAQAVNLVTKDGSRAVPGSSSDAVVDRMEDELTARCAQLADKIDAAWKTRVVAQLRPACNHAVARFGTFIQPLIDQLVASTDDEDRRHRARTLGVNLLIHIAEGYEAIDNHMAAQRTLETALKIAANTPAEPKVINLLEKVKKPAQRQKAGVPAGQRNQEKPEFKVMPGGKVKEESWVWSIPTYGWVFFISLALGVMRLTCSMAPDRSSGSGQQSDPAIPHFDSNHPPQVGTPR